jgi:hypothetical protein
MLTAETRGGCYNDWGSIFVYRAVVNIYSGGRVVEAKSRRSDYGGVAGIRRRNPGCWRSTDLFLRSKKYRASVRDL